MLLQILLEGAPVAELIHEVVVVLADELLVVGDDVGAGADHPQHLDLVIHTFLELLYFLEFFGRDNLDCVELGVELVLGLEDVPVAACPHPLQQGIIIYNFYHAPLYILIFEFEHGAL